MVSEKILLVENEGTARVRLRRLLRAWGYTPVVTTSGEHALQQAARERPTLVLMDIKLAGDLDGITTARELRARYDLPTIYLTAYVDEELLQRARATEPYGYLVKPVQEMELRATLEMALAKCRQDKLLQDNEKALQRRAQELALLNRASQAFSSSLNLHQVLVTVLDEVRSLMNAVGASIWLVRVETSEVVCEHSAGLGSETVRGWHLPLGHGIVGWTAQHGESVISPNSHIDERYFKGVETKMGTELHSILSVPLRIKENIIGVLQLVDKQYARFNDTDRVLLESLAASAAIAIDNARLFAQAQQELTARKQAEQAKERNAARFRGVFAQAAAGIAIALPNEKIVEVNETLCDMLGYPKEELLKLTVQDITFPEDRAKEFQYTRDVITGKKDYFNLEKRYVHKRGHLIWGYLSSSVVRDQQGDIRLVIGVVVDITARKRVEAALRESEEKFRSVVAQSADGIVLVDQRGHIVEWNRGAEKLTGLAYAEIQEQPLWNIQVRLLPSSAQSPQLYAQFRETTRQALATGQAPWLGRANGMEIVHQVTGERRYLQWQTFLVKVSSGFMIGSILRDLTTFKETEQTLKHQTAELTRINTELQQLAYAVSHDVAPPLRMLKFEVGELATGLADQLDAATAESLRYIEEAITWMQQLVDDLRDYSQVHTRDQKPALIACDAILKRTLQWLKLDIANHNATVTYDPLPQVWADATQLEQLCQNLLSNALKFHGATPPRVHISAQAQETDWLFSIRDDGIGIAPENYERIFEVFQRLHTRAEYAGTGIGLAICKRIVERHGGRIWVESEVGQGTTFYFTLPRGAE